MILVHLCHYFVCFVSPQSTNQSRKLVLDGCRSGGGSNQIRVFFWNEKVVPYYCEGTCLSILLCPINIRYMAVYTNQEQQTLLLFVLKTPALHKIEENPDLVNIWVWRFPFFLLPSHNYYVTTVLYHYYAQTPSKKLFASAYDFFLAPSVSLSIVLPTREGEEFPVCMQQPY